MLYLSLTSMTNKVNVDFIISMGFKELRVSAKRLVEGNNYFSFLDFIIFQYLLILGYFGMNLLQDITFHFFIYNFSFSGMKKMKWDRV